MAIAPDTVSHSSQSSGASLTWAHTVGNGIANPILVVSVKVGASNTCSGVTYNGTSLTQLTSQPQGTVTVYIFSLVNPTHDGAAHNIVASFSSSTGGSAGCAASYSGVAQSSTWGTPATNSGSSGNSSVTVTTTASSQKVVDINSTTAFTSDSTPSASQTKETSDVSVGGSTLDFGDITATGSSMNLSWTNQSNSGWAELAAPMNAFVSGGGPPPTRIVISDSGMSPGSLPGSVW